jgi:RNA polymerase sigma factor (sigma-70 family)
MRPTVTGLPDQALLGLSTVTDVQPERTSVALLPLALSGDRDAWARIVEDHTKLLWWIARSHRLDEDTTADVVQTVWLQLLRFGHRIEDPKKLPGWLATTARREALRRTSAREIPTEHLADNRDPSVTPVDEHLVDEETIGIVLAAFAKLSEHDRRLLRLVCAVPPKSYEEIAVLLGKTVGYIGPTRRRALERLRAHLEEMGLS